MGWWEKIQWTGWKVLGFLIPESWRRCLGWFWIHHTHATYVVGVFVVVFRNSEVLLVDKEGVDPGWKIPGGGKEHNLTLETQARAELYQETGVRVRGLKLVMNHVDEVHRDFHVVFLGVELHGEIDVHDKDEIRVAKFVPVDDARKLLSEDHLKFLNRALAVSSEIKSMVNA